MREFLGRYLPKTPGPIRESEGVAVGDHQGLAYYTLGQRQGLGIGGTRGRQEAPWYVAGKDQLTNTLVATQEPRELEADWLAATDLNWFVEPPTAVLNCAAKVRYRQADQACRVTKRADGDWLVEFAAPQRSITPGQYVCLYDGELCLGGGVIRLVG